VTVVIPSWNGREMLDLVLPTLAAQTLQPLRLLVVDNGSGDGSAEHVRERYPDAEVLALAENVGFAAAVNAGIAAADTEYVALFNNDMEIDPGCVEALVAALDADPSAGSATAKMLMLREPGTLDGAGDELTWWGGAWRRAHGAPDDGRWDRPGPVLSACGGAALYRRAALEAVGPFDPSFFAYLEDVDWGVRAQLQGWSCVYAPAAVVHHLGAATSSRVGDLQAYLVQRNLVTLVLKDFPAARLAVAAPALLAFQAWRLVRADRRAPLLRGWRDALRRLPATLRARRAVQATRVSSLRGAVTWWPSARR
jgi:GT2 family glycosyltransferase